MKMRQICVICGSEAFAKNMCETCFLEKHELFQVPKKIRLKHCTNCGSYYDKYWTKESVEDILKRKIASKNKILKKEVEANRGYAMFFCSGYVKPSEKMKNEGKKVPLIIENRKCDNCIKLLSGYYQAIFQVRGPRKEKIMKKVISIVRENEVIPEKNKIGYDIKFVDKKNAARTAGLLKDLSIKKTYKLITEKKGKKLYRDYYSIR